MRRRSKFIPTLAAASQVVGALVLVALTTGQGAVQATSTNAADGAELRAAVTAVNSTNGQDDTITLTSAGPYVLDCGTNEDSNTDGDLDYTSNDDLTITFAGPGRATIEIDQTGSGCTTDRVIHHRGGGTLTLERVKITGGDLSGVTGPVANGGGILTGEVAGVLVLNDVAVEGNRASNGGDAPKDPQGGAGGGIYVKNGSATITDSIISGNHAGNGGGLAAGSGGNGGGIYGHVNTSVSLLDTDVRSNRAGDGAAGSGGGIFASSGAAVDIVGGSIGGPSPSDGNKAGDAGTSASGSNGTLAGGGGGISTVGPLSTGGTTIANNTAGTAANGDNANGGRGGNGGGISSIFGSVEIANSLVFDNAATAGGDATGGLGGAPGNGGGIFVQSVGADLTITGSQITGNESGNGGNSDTSPGVAGGNGGGIYFAGASFTMTNTTAKDNTTGNGGNTPIVGGQGGRGAGVFTSKYPGPDPVVTVDRSTIADNTTGSGGTGSTPGFGGDGGGIEFFLTNGTATVTRSTISGNSAGRHGGGIYGTNGQITVTNSTIDGNTAGSFGGGIYANQNPDIDIVASTVTSNSSGAPGANVTQDALGGPINLVRTLVADPRGGGSNCDGAVGGGDSLEQASSGVFSCGTTNSTATLDLAPLADNGGPTETRLTGTGWNAFDAIAPGNCVESIDQRGTTRPKGSGCDIGAVELNPSISAANDTSASGSAGVVIDVLANDSATETTLDPSTVKKTSGPSQGTVTFSASTGKATYTPNAGFNGADGFTYEVCGIGVSSLCDTATVMVTVTVTPPPPPPPPPPVTAPGVVTITPARLLDSRPGATTVDGQQQGIGRRSIGTTTVQIAGRAGVPTNADAAIINIGAINPENGGFITTYPCDKNQPGSSTLNYTTGTTIANGATIKLSTQGTICIFTNQPIDLIVDVTGYTPNIP